MVRNAGLVVVALLVALTLGEAVVRWRGVDLHPAARFRFHPRYGWTMDPADLRPDGYLESGFRSPAFDVPDAGGPRVLVLGDSFSIAIEHRWAGTFPGILAAELAARDGRLANLSAGGWGTAQEYRALLDEGLAWKPDVVVLQVFPYNDVCNNGLALADTCSWQDYLRPYYVPGPEGLEATWLHPWRGRARVVSRLFGLLEREARWRRIGSPGDSPAEFRRRTRETMLANARAVGLELDGQLYSLVPDPHQPEPVRAAWRATEALFAALHQELANRDIPLVALVIPSSKTFGGGWEALRRGHRIPLEADHGTRRVESALARLGATVVSVRGRIGAERLESASLFNHSNQHLSTAGHRRVAGWLREELVRLETSGRGQ